MPEKIFIKDLLRLTLTQKGKAVAKHPLLRENVIEAIKASVSPPGNPDDMGDTWPEAPQDDEPGSDADWYGDFAAHIATISGDDIPEDWVSSFNTIPPSWADSTTEKAIEKAASKKKPNYPASRGPFAGPHNSFPIKSQQDVYDAARLVGHAANPAAVRARIIRIAHSKGFSLPKSWTKTKKSEVLTDMDEAQFEALVTRLTEALAPLAEKAEPVAPVTPAEPVTPEAPVETVAKAEHDAVLARVVELEKALEDVKKANEASLQSKDAELATTSKAATEAAAAATAAAETLKAALEEAKKPLTLGADDTVTKARADISKMSFDDAFMARLHS